MSDDVYHLIKATRADGRDFHTGKVDYLAHVGKWLEVDAAPASEGQCAAGIHASPLAIQCCRAMRGHGPRQRRDAAEVPAPPASADRLDLFPEASAAPRPLTEVEIEGETPCHDPRCPFSFHDEDHPCTFVPTPKPEAPAPLAKLLRDEPPGPGDDCWCIWDQVPLRGPDPECTRCGGTGTVSTPTPKPEETP